MVTSRATSACHSLAAACTSMTAPVVSAASNVMVATTATRPRPEIVARGTIGVLKRGSASTASAASALRSRAACACAASVIDMDAALVQHQTAGVVLIHQRNVVGGDDDRGAGLVELDEQ